MSSRIFFISNAEITVVAPPEFLVLPVNAKVKR